MSKRVSKIDRISTLPPGIIETILCLLPIQEAARTSILSREWRYHWIKIPKLVFNERPFQQSKRYQWTKIPKLTFVEDAFEDSTDGAELPVLEKTFSRPSERKQVTKGCKLLYAIHQVLLMHQGPIHEFTLSMKIEGSCVDIDHIILHLSKRNTVKILKLDFSYLCYVLPLSFSSLHQLTNLRLKNCCFGSRLSFSGFGGLTTLCLQHPNIHVKTLLCLLSSCPLLKRLTLDFSNGVISYNEDFTIVDLFKCIPMIEYLDVPCYIVQYFVPERLPKELPTTLIHLKCLCIDYACVDFKHAVLFLVLLIRSSPNLEKLKLEMRGEYNLEDDEFSSLMLEDYFDFTSLEHVKELELLNFRETTVVLDFVKLILAKSPVLKKVTIFPYPPSDEEAKSKLNKCVSKVLLRYPCASPMVKITVG